MKLTDAIFRSKKKAYKRGIRTIKQKKRFGKVVVEGKEI
jgi:hypothetical protein